MIIRNGVRHNTSNFGSSGNANIVKLTQSEYDALPESKKSDGILYAITDGDGLSAKNLAFDDSETGLVSFGETGYFFPFEPGTGSSPEQTPVDDVWRTVFLFKSLM